MATTVEPIKNTEYTGVQQERAPKINWLIACAIFVLGVAGIAIFRWYAQNYSFEYGLDYFEPEFAIYWMNLLYAELILITALGIAGTVAVWLTRPKEVSMTPHQELNIYMLLLAGLAGGGILAPVVISLFVEADAAWHQVTIRDTDFTPTHIQLFYGIIPLLVAGGVIGFLWIHTRMPDFRNRISFPLALAIAGPIMIMPNLGFNEWGHTFFYAEELFAAPIHWGFVTLGWAVFGIGGLIVQILNRIVKLTRVVSSGANPVQG
ncbi:MAG TPA: methane monooxygenase/ammonia monooxygenase subunit C [Pseudomonadales bacterium]